MSKERIVQDHDLASLAKKFREESGVTKAQAARELDVSFASVHNAEEDPDRSLTELRRRMIERYSQFRVIGPEFRLEKKQ